MIKADVLITNREWTKYISNPKLYIAKKLKRFEKKISLFKNNDLTFSIQLSGDIEVKKLNKKFRKKTKTTDILSFPSCEKEVLKKTLVKNKKFYLGDVIINLSQIIQQSKKSNFKFTFDRIWVHGLTHLFGYRHKSNKDFFAMQKIEDKILSFIK